MEGLRGVSICLAFALLAPFPFSQAAGNLDAPTVNTQPAFLGRALVNNNTVLRIHTSTSCTGPCEYVYIDYRPQSGIWRIVDGAHGNGLDIVLRLYNNSVTYQVKNDSAWSEETDLEASFGGTVGTEEVLFGVLTKGTSQSEFTFTDGLLLNMSRTDDIHWIRDRDMSPVWVGAGWGAGVAASYRWQAHSGAFGVFMNPYIPGQTLLMNLTTPTRSSTCLQCVAPFAEGPGLYSGSYLIGTGRDDTIGKARLVWADLPIP